MVALTVIISNPLFAATACPSSIDEVLIHRGMPEYQTLAFEVRHVGEKDAFSRHERYEPEHAPNERWVLLEHDGEMPNTEDRIEFANRRIKVGNPLLDILRDRTLGEFTLIDSDANRIRYRFQPERLEVGTAEGEMNVADFVSGEAIILDDSDIGCVLTFRLSSPESFSPRFGINVKQLSITRRFVMDDASGLFHPDTSVLVLNGRAFLVAGFNLFNRSTYQVIDTSTIES